MVERSLCVLHDFQSIGSRLEATRHLVRLAHGLRLVSNHTYQVGRMIGGFYTMFRGRSVAGA